MNSATGFQHPATQLYPRILVACPAKLDQVCTTLSGFFFCRFSYSFMTLRDAILYFSSILCLEKYTMTISSSPRAYLKTFEKRTESTFCDFRCFAEGLKQSHSERLPWVYSKKATQYCLESWMGEWSRTLQEASLRCLIHCYHRFQKSFYKKCRGLIVMKKTKNVLLS